MNAEDFRKAIGHRIKIRRTELKLHQKELAERIGLAQTYISQWEQGTRAMRIEQAAALAQALEMTLSDLTGEETLTKIEL